MRIPGADDEESSDVYAVPQRGHAPSFYWPETSRLVADHVSAGAFDSAARILEETIGIVQLAPFKSLFLSIYAKFVLIVKIFVSN
jgi:coatomer protein complex subunit alpha (xenin)